MNEPRLNFFTKIYYSIASFDSYRFFIRQRTGKAVLYLLLLSFLVTLAGILQPIIESNKIITQVVGEIEDIIPDFNFENGRLNVDAQMPLIIDDGGMTIIIDTSGNTDESILNNYDMALLIMRDQMIQKNFANQQVTDFSVFQSISFDRSDIKNLIPLAKWLFLIILAIAVPFFIAGRFISVLFISIIALIINSARNANLPYRSIYTISTYALTLPLILCTILDFANVPFLLSTLVYYLIAGIYAGCAISAIKRHEAVPGIPPMNDAL